MTHSWQKFLRIHSNRSRSLGFMKSNREIPFPVPPRLKTHKTACFPRNSMFRTVLSCWPRFGKRTSCSSRELNRFSSDQRGSTKRCCDVGDIEADRHENCCCLPLASQAPPLLFLISRLLFTSLSVLVH